MGTLGYESRARREPWGPVLVLPSPRTTLLLLLAAGAAARVRVRHEPWVAVRGFVLLTSGSFWLRGDGDGAWPPAAAFSPDGRLLVLEQDGVLRSYDPASLRPARELHRVAAGTGATRSRPRPHAIAFLHGGAQVLAMELGEPHGLVIDTATGAVVRRTRNLLLSGYDDVTASADASRVLAVGPPTGPGPAALALVAFDLSPGAPEDGRPRDLARWPQSYRPLRDGTLVEVEPARGFADPVEFGRTRLLRADDGAEVAHGGWVGGLDLVALTEHHRVVAKVPSRAAAPPYETQVQVRELTTDALLATFAVLATTRLAGASTDLSATSSDDGRRLVVGVGDAQWRTTGAVLIDLDEGRATPLIGPAGGWRFLPGSRLLVGPHEHYAACGIFDHPGGQPLALLGDGGRLSMSPDGRFLLAQRQGQAVLWRRAGFECRMSCLGVLGMPRAWLLIAALAAAAISLADDARRQPGGSAAEAPAWATWWLGAAAWAATATFILSAALGQWRWELAGGPAVLLALILSRTRARAWRAILLLALAAAAITSGEAARRAWPARAQGWRIHQVLDRRYALPAATAGALHAVAATLAIGAMAAILLRPRR